MSTGRHWLYTVWPQNAPCFVIQWNHFLMDKKEQKFHPAVDKRVLIALSGATWIIVGSLLVKLALGWLSPVDLKSAFVLGLTGITLALLVHHFGFLRLVDRNIERIMDMKDKVCIFAFQAWKSYAIIAVMVGMGITLRQSSLPKPYLAVIYIGFGGAMVLSSIRYIRTFSRLVLRRKTSLN